jgi:crossover junction endodeoxyribonuclease RuvC
MIILGIDPGIGRIGWALIKDESSKQVALDYGLLETPVGEDIEKRLSKIHQFILELILRIHPDVVAIEQLFFAANSKTALTVGQARGVIILAASNASVPIVSYTPLQIKQALTGYGRADKKQIQMMVKSILKLTKPLTQDDTADALAVALTHAFSYKMQHSSQKSLK